MVERTLSIVKPDGTRRNLIGKIVNRFEEENLTIVGMRMHWLSKREAEGFYIVHKERPFFGELVDFMSSGPVVLMVLEGENAVSKNRNIMGATNPADAEPGTIRKEFALSIGQNTVHGSDSLENAEKEIRYFFAASDLVSQANIAAFEQR